MSFAEIPETSAHLFADPDHEATYRIISAFLDSGLSYLFTPDEYKVRPEIITEFGSFVGEEEILRSIGKLLVPMTYPKIPRGEI